MKAFEKWLANSKVITGFIITLLIVGSSFFLLAEKSPGKGYLGVSIGKLSPEEREEYGVSYGVRVVQVVEGEAAESAGIKEDDVIQYFGNNKIRTPEDLVDAVRSTEPDTKVKIKLVHQKKTKVVSVTLGKLKSPVRLFCLPDKKGFHIYMNKKAYIGIHLRRLNDELADYFGRKMDEGVLILKVEKDSPAEKAGLLVGDVIIGMGKLEISTPEDIHEFLDDRKGGDKVKLTIIRHRKKRMLSVELGEKSGHSKFNIFKWKSDDKVVIEIPEIYIPEFHIEIPDVDECKIILHKNLENIKKRLEKVKERLHKKFRYIKTVYHI